jgi:hypothetical protein
VSFSAVGRSALVGYGPFPGGFYGYTYGGPWLLGPPVIVVAQPVIVVQPIVVPAVAGPPPPDTNRFMVIRPDRPKQAPARPPAPPPPVLPPPIRAEKKPKEVDLGIVPGPLPLARDPAANPRLEAERQIQIGREAFTREEFGRALERFRQATLLFPDEAAAWFLLGQAQFAVGKYDEATASMVAGLKRQPDWPLSAFRSRSLYRAIPFLFDVHLQDLRLALAADPVDPRLLFLLAVELWFDGRRDEAKPLFEKVVLLATDPTPAREFLKVGP